MPSRAPKAFVDRTVLQWLRNSAGLSVDEVALRLQTKPDNVAAWEAGEKQLSMPQLRQLAQTFKRPISDFFLPRPMPEPPIPHDFRRLPDDGRHSYSAALRHELRVAYRRRIVALDLAADIEIKPKKFALWTSISLRDDPEDVGTKIRRALGVETEQQRRWRNTRNGYNAWRQKIEGLDVLVFQVTSVDRSQMLGFSLGFDEYPVIGINRKSKLNSRTFTLLHEFAHLLLGESAICDFDEDALRPPREQEIEIFCNHVAGAALVPSRDLLEHPSIATAPVNQTVWQDETLIALARDFCVSEEVILRRMLINNRTTREFYTAKRQQYTARFRQLEIEEHEASSNDFKRNIALEAASNLGAFARLVVNGYNSDAINLTDASKFLGVKAEKVAAVGEYIR